MRGMRSKYVPVLLALSLAVAGLAFAAEAEKTNLKVGSTYFVCNCPPGCCEVISSKEGECGCKKPLVKATVTKVEDGKAWFKADGWKEEKVMKTVGLYVFECPASCKCLVPWYGGARAVVDWATGTALWYTTGTPPLAIRWVLVRDPHGKLPLRAFFSSEPAQAAPNIIADFVNRWPLEVTFEEARTHLGLETQRQWNDLAINALPPRSWASFP